MNRLPAIDHDDPILGRLRGDLDAFVADVTAPPSAVPVGAARVFSLDGAREGRRRFLVGAAAAASVVALVVGLAVIGSRRGDAPSDSTRPPATTTGVPAPAAETKPVPPTPDGWVVVEWGDVRLSVPPELSPFDASTGCQASATGDGAVGSDQELGISCGEDSIAVRPLVAGTSGERGELNGLDVERQAAECESCPQALLVPELDREVVVRRLDTADADAILATVGVSSVWRSLHEPPPAVPADWVRHEPYPGVALSLPPGWWVREIGADGIDPDSCDVRPLESGLLVGHGASDAMVAFCVRASVLPPSDGVRVFPVTGDTVVDDAPGHPFREITVSPTGSDTTYLVRVGFGGDGMIGRTILGSLSGATIEPTPTPTLPPAETTGTSEPSEPLPSGPTTTVPKATVPTTVPPTTEPPGELPVYDGVGTVIETADHGPRLCFGVLDSLPPQCGSGIDLDGFSWDGVADEQSMSGTTWHDLVWFAGTYDAAAGRLHVTVERDATREDAQARRTGVFEPDFSVPCDPPTGGWPAAEKPDFPGEQIARIPGYAGAWIDPLQRIYTVKFTGDLTAAEAAVRELYDGALCIAPAERDATALAAIQDQLMALSSVQVMDTATFVDAGGEWVTGNLIAPNPDLQAALDEQFGTGVVRLSSYLQPASG